VENALGDFLVTAKSKITSKGRGRTVKAAAQKAPKPQAAVPPAAFGPVALYCLSDSTGNLPQHMLAAFLTQFPRGSFDLRTRNFLDAPHKVEAALEEIRTAPGIVCHAFVLPETKQRIADFCAAGRLACRDLTGGFVDFLSRESEITPAPDRKLLHRVDTMYHQRIEAIEYTLSHDDGLGLETLGDADVVLTGVSRTSKTPTSIYLAQQGYKVANVSLAQGVSVPGELLAAPQRKIVGLLIDPSGWWKSAPSAMPIGAWRPPRTTIRKRSSARWNGRNNCSANKAGSRWT
jgi:regulator of PEP synthase PpsR (kinase-PPPase family)